ncbi:peptidylprolyl isomerase [Rhizobium sp.]|uniref:peptidylprolyl isomerase n=1 Tax=Rhizobium sp. TaxID=391 RepID=UPI000E91117A|nr:peptidylprolyl isomerase [Rhizobium sp.]
MSFLILSSARKSLRLIPALLLAGVVLAGPARADGDVLARVNGKDITKAEVDMAMDVFGQQLAQVPDGAKQSMVLDALIDMHVVADAAAASGVKDDPKYKARISFLDAQALRNTYLEDQVQAKITDDEIKARYEKDIAGYTPPEEVHARHILVKTEDEAKAIIADLAKGGDFAKIAEEKSQDPGSAKQGGDLGFFAAGDMVPEFEKAAGELKPGEVTKTPVKTQFGFHVIKVEDIRDAAPPKFEDVEQQVRQLVMRDKYLALLDKAKASEKVDILDADLKKGYEEISKNQAGDAAAPADAAPAAPKP